MRLGEMLNNFINQNSVSVKATGSAEALQLPSNIASQIKALTPGQILQGEVLESSGDTVKLLVNVNGESIPLQAKLEHNIMLTLGKSLLFQVKNNGSALSLSPLFENMGMEQNAAKALESASLPVNATTMSMTGKLMQEGMSIDKSSLQQIYQEVLANQDAELMDIIDLHKLGMQVTGENLSQIHSYKHMTHQLTGGIEQMSRELTQLIQNMVENGQERQIEPFLKAIFLPEENTGTLGQESVQGQKTVLTEAGVLPDTMQLTEENSVGQHTGVSNTSEEMQVQNHLNPQNMTTEQLLKELFGKLELAAGEKSALTEMVNGDILKAGINELLQRELLLKPEASEKDNVQELYQRLGKQLNVLSEALAKVGQDQSPLGKTVQNMSQNVNFLQQMNSMYAYVQLPVKLSEGTAHGELYVYSNKKHLASNDGEVSALLHLDMEHLGPVDVHVKLKETKVNTQFFLRDEELLDFLYEHIDILTERLKKRGYDMTCRMTVRGEQEHTGEENTTFKELLKENSNIPMLVNYSFDVRA